jgi:hypothetical protein
MRFLRGVTGRVLACGCLVGVYETYGGEIVATIDARGSFCTQAGHLLHAMVPAVPSDTAPESSRDLDGVAPRS